MIHVDDVVRGTAEFIATPSEKLTQRIYNMNGCAFTPEEQVEAITKVVPGFRATYKPDFRQEIALSWPESLDDSKARIDWGWKPKHDLASITEDMISNLKKK